MGLCLLGLGGLFFTTCFLITVSFLKNFGKGDLDNASLYVIALRTISSLQAVIACCVGAVIVSSCSDVLNDRLVQHWLAEAYAWFGAAYFYYDTWAMYLAYWYKTPRVQGYPTSKAILQFMKSNKVMMFHHLALPVLFLPVLVWWRQGIGDFFVGCFYMLELAIPCVSLRAIMLQFKQEHTKLYAINGIIAIIAFAVCRVFIFPFMYWAYSHQIGVSVFEVPGLIPKKCNIGCALLLSLQVHWLVYMIKIALRTVRSLRKEASENTAIQKEAEEKEETKPEQAIFYNDRLKQD